MPASKYGRLLVISFLAFSVSACSNADSSEIAMELPISTASPLPPPTQFSTLSPTMTPLPTNTSTPKPSNTPVPTETATSAPSETPASIDSNLNELNMVLIENKEAAYRVYFGIPKDIKDEELAEIQAIVSAEEGVSLVSWVDFEQNLDELVTDGIIKNEYEDSQVAEGIAELIQMYPMTPFGLTWNGGIAFTSNDYEHTKEIYQQYLTDPDKYEETRNRDPKGDPINPQNHLGPLLGW
jgi:hypothetical protein